MYSFFKRTADIVFALIGLAISIPILLFCIIMLLLSGESSPIYTSYRIGKNGELFKMFKLRTMARNSRGKNPLTSHNDNRVSFLGRFLRFTKIDELPQFFNILSGDLSFVGPRPLLPEVFIFYPIEVQKKLNTIPPGVTGIGSIVFRNEAKLFKKAKGAHGDFYKEYIAPVKGDLEMWYVKNRSIRVDFKILIFTIAAVIYGQVKTIDKKFNGLPSTQIEFDK